MTLRELQARVNQLVAENDLSADNYKNNDLPVVARTYKVNKRNQSVIVAHANPISFLYRTPLTLSSGKQVIELSVAAEKL